MKKTTTKQICSMCEGKGKVYWALRELKAQQAVLLGRDVCARMCNKCNGGLDKGLT